MAARRDLRDWRDEADGAQAAYGPHSGAGQQAGRVVQLVVAVGDLEDRLSAREGELQAKSSIIDGLERQLRRAKESTTEAAFAHLERKIGMLEGRIERARSRDANNTAVLRRLYERVRTAESERDELSARAARGRLRDLDVDARAPIGADHVLRFGKHCGLTLGHVAATEPTYVVWMDNQHSTHRPSGDVLQVAHDVIAGMKRRERDAQTARPLLDETPLGKIRRGIELRNPSLAHGFFEVPHGCPASLIEADGVDYHAVAADRRVYPVDGDCHFPVQPGREGERFHRAGRGPMT